MLRAAVHGPKVTAVQVRTRCGIIWTIWPQEGQRHLRRCIGVVGPKRARYAGAARVRVTENRSDTVPHDTVPQRGRVPRFREPMLLLVGANSNPASRH